MNGSAFLRILGKLFSSVLTLALIVIVAYLLVNLTPGDLADVLAGEEGVASPELMARLRADYGLDLPAYVRFVNYFSSVAALDLGYSFRNGMSVRAVVATDVRGLTILDDWDGFGQALTASGTIVFDAVRVATDDISPGRRRSRFTTAYAQISHLATLSGIGRAAADAAAIYVRARTRTYSHAAASTAAADPQVQARIGQVYARVHAANVLTLAVAHTLDRAITEAASITDDAAHAGLVGRLEIETYRAQVIVQEQVLTAISTLFDALGASALSRQLGWDRFWRNARTIAPHNPVIYKERLIGDHAINGALPPPYWIAGTA